MAERRMFAKTIIDSDAFLDMPLSTQALYFHLNMRADDDGFVNNPRKIQRMIGASDDDLKLLIAKAFIIIFESGVIVIKHWRLNNWIRGDRHHSTVYQEEFGRLSLKENGSYSLCQTDGCQLVATLDTEVRLGKDSLDKDIDILSDKPEPFSYPYAKIVEYLNEKAGTNYKATGNKTRTLIKARFNDGFTLDDFYKVIDNKVADWQGTNMAQYLRPETLFGTKFEGYLNAKSVPKKQSNQFTAHQGADTTDYDALMKKIFVN